MKKILSFFFMLCIVSASHADEIYHKPVLDSVIFQVTARQWVTTKTALLTINMNATLSNADLVQVRAEISERLGKIATGDWHITQFDRAQDSSGLEKLYVQAQARIDQSLLTNVYQNAKSVTKPGTKYEIGSIDFTPSVEEVQQVKNQLRETLYRQVNAEMTRMNKVYAGQNYSLNELEFFDGNAAPMRPYMQEKAVANVMAMQAAQGPAVVVSNELTMTAVAKAASNRKIGE